MLSFSAFDLLVIMRTIIHVDMDCFYAAVEQKDNPELRGKPVVVGADPAKGRGVVSAASYEARKFGIHSAMPINQAFRRCPHAVFLPVRIRRYREESAKIMKILQEFTSLIEPMSLDEAFLDVTANVKEPNSAVQIGRKIKQKIRQELGLVASVGVGPNKLVAKIASALQKPDGFVVVEPQRARDFLAPLPVEKLWGVGKVTQQVLKGLGIETIGQLASYPLKALESKLGKAGKMLWEFANGIDNRPVESTVEPKSIGRETTFDQDVSEREELESTLLALSEEISHRLKKSGKMGRTVTLKLRFFDFSTLTRSQTLLHPTDLTEKIYKTSLLNLNKINLRQRKVRLLGISVSRLETGSPQLSLFETENQRLRQVEKAVEEIRERFGTQAVVRARLLKRKNLGELNDS